MASIARNKLVVCVCAVVLALIAVGFGVSRGRTYTASTSLQIGQVNPNSPGFYSYVESAAALATAFSRAVSAEPVLATVQQKLKLSPKVADARLSAEPLPQSPVFRVIATGPTETAATQLANVASDAIVAYEGKINDDNPEAATLLHEYSIASLAVAHARAKLAELESTTREASASSHSKHSHQSASTFAPDKAEISTTEARLKAIESAYTAAVTSQAPRSGLISLLAGATSATSDRNSKLEKYGFIGLLAGIVIGCALAVLRERLRKTRLPAHMALEAQEHTQL